MVRRFRTGLIPFLILSWLIILPQTAAADSPHVAGYVRAHAALPPTVEAGNLLLTELNCVSCHAVDVAQAAGLASKPAPNLSDVGSRIHTAYLTEYLLNPGQAKPGTTMPDVLAGVPAGQRQQAASALAAFLSATGRVAIAPPLTAAVQQGQDLFHQVGCAACHQPQEGDQPALATSTPLPQLDQKYSVPSLTQFLADPLAVRAGGRMPHLGLTDAEARAVASYLLKDIDVPASVVYRYYEGNWDKLPDFNTLEVKSEGQALGFDLSVKARDNQFALVFDSFLTVPQDGEYTFHLGSDDGSRLLLAEETLAEVDGIHPVVRTAEKRRLKQGVYPIQVQFFEQGGGEELYVEWEGPGLKRQTLDAFLSPTAKGLSRSAGEASASEELIASGQRWYKDLGCANCHDLDLGKGPLASSLEARPFKSNEGGCLTGNSTSPRYGLNDHQQASLALAIDALSGTASRTPSTEDRVHATMVRFNCIACHSRGDLGGVEEARQEFFIGTQPDVGDEGRLPPLLAGVGAKLNPGFFQQLLDKGANDRFYMLTRMPGFGLPNVGHLVDDLAELDPLSDVPVVDTTEPERRLKVAGRQLTGDQGLSCIKCHVFGDYRATGIQAISLTTMTQRLRKDWFQKYMLDPNALRPGTRMPESWPGGATFFRKLLDGKANTQIHALWVYLEDADNANRPSGLDSVGIELTPTVTPLVYRNFIEGAGSRAIAVGYPERVNLAFDANEMRLALLWQGAFIDASRHWTGRGQGYQPPLGDNVVNLPAGTAWARLADPQDAWPSQSAHELGIQFKGYRFDKERRPAFLYEWNGMRVSDQPLPIPDPSFPGLRRHLTAEGERPESLWFRVVTSPEISSQNDATVFRTQDGMTVSLDGKVTPVVRQTPQGQELLLQIEAGTAPLRWTLEYRW